MPKNLELIREYIRERETYSFEERQALRETLRKGIKRVDSNFIAFVDLLNGTEEI